MKKILFILALMPMLAGLPLKTAAQAQKTPEGIVLSFRAGNASELAKFFHDNVELIILEEEDVYSSAQAEQIIRKFFSGHKPEAFKIIFEGGKENSRYAIGSLASAGISFRVYFLMKKQDGSSLIHQLRIEEEENEQ